MSTRPAATETLHPLLEPTLFYNPPYERQLEDEFAWHLVKYLNPSTALSYQYEAETPCGKFWIDFVVEAGPFRIGFELGDMEGQPDEEQEGMRDAAIIGCGAVDVLYRLRAADVAYHLNDALAVIARWQPELFSARGHINLNTLASPELAACAPRPADTEVNVMYGIATDEYDGEAFTWPGDEQAPPSLVVRRLALGYPAGWLCAYDRALVHYGVSPDDLKHRWAKTA
jgi:hypothetical protein